MKEEEDLWIEVQKLRKQNARHLNRIQDLALKLEAANCTIEVSKPIIAHARSVLEFGHEYDTDDLEVLEKNLGEAFDKYDETLQSLDDESKERKPEPALRKLTLDAVSHGIPEKEWDTFVAKMGERGRVMTIDDSCQSHSLRALAHVDHALDGVNGEADKLPVLNQGLLHRGWRRCLSSTREDIIEESTILAFFERAQECRLDWEANGEFVQSMRQYGWLRKEEVPVTEKEVLTWLKHLGNPSTCFLDKMGELGWALDRETSEQEVLSWLAQAVDHLSNMRSDNFVDKITKTGFIPKTPGSISHYIRNVMPKDSLKELWRQGVGAREDVVVRLTSGHSTDVRFGG